MCKINIGVYLFKNTEQNYVEAYSPTLRLASSGTTEAEAKREFLQTMQEYFDHCTAHNTLFQDLQQIGWKFTSDKAVAPSVSHMLRHDDIFREILGYDNFKKFSTNHELALAQ